VKVLRDEKGRVDFEAPIDMTEQQTEQFKRFFEEKFEDVFFQEVKEPDRTGEGDNGREVKSWELEDYLTLLKTNSNNEAAEKLDRTEMSIRMKRGSFQPKFLEWAKNEGYTKPLKNCDGELLEEYFGEEE